MLPKEKLYLALGIGAIGLLSIGICLHQGRVGSSFGVGCCAWGIFFIYNILDDLLSRPQPQLKRDGRELMFAFSSIPNVNIEFWEKFRLTSHALSSRYTTYFRFARTTLKNCLNVVFLTAMIDNLPAYDYESTKVMGAYVMIWVEIPIAYAYVAAWLFTLVVLLTHTSTQQSRYQDQNSLIHARSWEVATTVRVCTEWYCWIGRFSSINLLRAFRISEPLLHLEGLKTARRLGLIMQVCFNCVFGFFALRYKVGLVAFAANKDYYTFTYHEWFLLLGFINNLFSVFHLDSILISAKIHAQQVYEKDWLTELAQQFSDRHRPLGSFMRMVALRPLDVDILMCELCKLELAFYEEQQPRNEGKSPAAHRQIVCLSQQERADPGVVPPLFSDLGELIKAYKDIRSQAQVRDDVENTSFGSGGVFHR